MVEEDCNSPVASTDLCRGERDMASAEPSSESTTQEEDEDEDEAPTPTATVLDLFLEGVKSCPSWRDNEVEVDGKVVGTTAVARSEPLSVTDRSSVFARDSSSRCEGDGARACNRSCCEPEAG